MYFDTGYIAKFYLPEAESAAVRALVHQSAPIRSAALVITELHCVLHRAIREGSLSRIRAKQTAAMFSQDLQAGLWVLSPVTENLLRRTAAAVLAAPDHTFLRTGDAIHLMTAQDLGEAEIWSNDRHLRNAAPLFGLAAMSF